MAPADRHDEATAFNDSVPGLRGNDRGSLAGDRVGIGKNFNLQVIEVTHLDLLHWHERLSRLPLGPSLTRYHLLSRWPGVR